MKKDQTYNPARDNPASPQRIGASDFLKHPSRMGDERHGYRVPYSNGTGVQRGNSYTPKLKETR